MNQLVYQHKLIRAIRKFFDDENFTEVFPPPLVENPGMETHIHPFEIYSKKENQPTGLYLNTSPEFKLKKVLAESDIDQIYSLAFSFRDEPKSPHHRPQFLMLEWYRKNVRYEKIMDDCEELLKFVQSELRTPTQLKDFPRISVQALFKKYLNFDILEFLEPEHLLIKIKNDFPDVPMPQSQCAWEDYFFLLFLNKIEPKLSEYPYLLIYDYPAPLSALSTLKKDDPRVCERFEIYLQGVEICNCFNELTDYNEQVKRFKNQSSEKKELYQYELPWPKEFLDVLKSGYPTSAGIALGVERLLLCLYQIENPFFE